MAPSIHKHVPHIANMISLLTHPWSTAVLLILARCTVGGVYIIDHV